MRPKFKAGDIVIWKKNNYLYNSFIKQYGKGPFKVLKIDDHYIVIDIPVPQKYQYKEEYYRTFTEDHFKLYPQIVRRKNSVNFNGEKNEKRGKNHC